MAAPAYRQMTAQTAVAGNARRASSRASVNVVRGSRPSSTPQAPSNATVVAALVAALLVVFALLSFARVAISSAAIAISIESQSLSSQIDATRAAGNKLEAGESVLTNSGNIKEMATKLGMTQATSSDLISLDKDIVALDSTGSLSLTESLRRASAAVQG